MNNVICGQNLDDKERITKHQGHIEVVDEVIING